VEGGGGDGDGERVGEEDEARRVGGVEQRVDDRREAYSPPKTL
jgi:hypothetical protein